MGIISFFKNCFYDILSLTNLLKKKKTSDSSLQFNYVIREEYNRLLVNDLKKVFYTFIPEDISRRILPEILYNINDVKINFSITPLPVHETMNDIKAELNSIREKHLTAQKNGSIESSFLLKEEESKKILLNAIRDKGKIFSSVGVLMSNEFISRNNITLLEYKSNILLRQMFFEQTQGARRFCFDTKNLNSKFLSNVNTFSINQIIPEKNNTGIFFGVSIDSKIPVFIDNFEYENPHIVIIAKSGAGKTHLAKKLAKRWLYDGRRVVLIDPEFELKDLAHDFEGSILEGKDWNFVDMYMQNINNVSYFKDLLEILSNQNDKLVPYLPLFFSANTVEEFQSTLSTLPDEIAYLVNSLIEITINEKTNLNDIIFCDFQAHSDLFISLYKMLSYFFSDERRETMIIIDEAHKVLDNEIIARLIRQAVKQGRKHKIGLCMISQDVLDFTQSNASKSVIANATIKILMKQENIYIPVLETLFDITGEGEFLIQAGVGEGLVIAGNEKYRLKF